jgi:hypothetical protein
MNKDGHTTMAANPTEEPLSQPTRSRRSERHAPAARIKRVGLLLGAGAALALAAGCNSSDEHSRDSDAGAPTSVVGAGDGEQLEIEIPLSMPPGDVPSAEIDELRTLYLEQLAGDTSSELQRRINLYVDKYVASWGAVRPTVVGILLPEQLVPAQSDTFRNGVAGLLQLMASGASCWSNCTLNNLFWSTSASRVDTDGVLIFGAGLRNLNSARADFGGRALTILDVASDITQNPQSYMPSGAIAVGRP